MMNGIYSICEAAVESIVSGDYTFLREQDALSRVSEDDIRRVLDEYDPGCRPVMPPEHYFEKGAYIVEYTDGSGYHVDLDLWYPEGRSDLTLKLDIRKEQGKLRFIIDDILVM